MTARMQPAAAAPSITVRRPRRSAVATTSRAMIPPTRTRLPATPWALLPAPNSSPAKGIVWVKRVLR